VYRLAIGLPLDNGLNNGLRDELAGFGTTDGNNVVKTQEGKSSGLMGICKSSDHSVQYAPNYLIELHGGEIVITFADSIVFRGTEEALNSETPNIASKVRNLILSGLQSKMSLE
jgi:hypothetical protein